MKIIFQLIMVLVFSFAVTACGNKGSLKSPTEIQKDEAKKEKKKAKAEKKKKEAAAQAEESK